MRIRFQADNDPRKAIVHGVLRSEPSVDFKSAQSARLDGVPDPQVLARAADENRLLVSHDLDTMPNHFRRFARSRRSPGVLLIPQDVATGRAIESLLLIWAATEPAEWENRLCLVPSLVTIALGDPA